MKNKILPKVKTIKSLGIMLIAILSAIASVFVPNFFCFANKVFANSENNENKQHTEQNVVLKDIPYPIDGAYNIYSAGNDGKCIDRSTLRFLVFTDNEAIRINNEEEEYVQTDQKFVLNAVESYGQSYVYNILSYGNLSRCLGVYNLDSEPSSPINVTYADSSKSQKFLIKEAYCKENGEYKFKGYVFLTGESDYEKAISVSTLHDYLKRELPYCVAQQDFNYEDIDLNQIWYLRKQFNGYTYYDNPGYYEKNKNNPDINDSYNINDKHDNHYSSWYWRRMEDSLTIDKTESWNYKNSRITQDGYTFFDRVELSVNIVSDMSYQYGYGMFNWWNDRLQVRWDNSNYVNGKYVNGTVGKGCLEIETLDENNQVFSTFSNNVLDDHGDKLEFSNGETSMVFDKVGRYTIRLYYSFETKEITRYVMRELKFAIASSSTTCEVIKANEEDKTLSSYELKLTNDDEIDVIYQGDDNLKADNEELINYLINNKNSLLKTDDKEYTKSDLIEEIKKYGEYKVYFTNTAFYMSSANNKNVRIDETTRGYNSIVRNSYFMKTPVIITDGVYMFESNNIFNQGKGNYYLIYVQSQPNKQVFRNVTYCYQDTEGKAINYAIDYAFLEDVKIFPYTMTLKMYYENIGNELTKDNQIEYKSNSIIYNTTNKVMKLKFYILDISGNESVIYLDIYPSSVPSMNKERLIQSSYNYNYKMEGYVIKLYDKASKQYKDYVFSSKEIATENLLDNVISNSEVCERRDDGSYVYKFDPYNKGVYIIFDTNENLVKYLYQYADSNIKFVVYSPENYKDFVLSEKYMFGDTLYLDKDFRFVTNETFPLFESYKINFAYYSEDGKLLKTGVITYNGEFKYQDTMFKILADEQETNWQSGYVVFNEFNISANSGSNYTAYIVNSNPEINIKSRQGAKLFNKYYNKDSFIECEEFQLGGTIGQDTSLRIFINEQEKYIFNSLNYEKIKFTDSGIYKITISNTHGFTFEVNIRVLGLSSNFVGVENYRTTTSEVKFKLKQSELKNFKCYINGKYQKQLDFVKTGEYYIHIFTPTNQDQNIFIIKDSLQFIFVLKGQKELDNSVYYDYESTYMPAKTVKNCRADLDSKLEEIDNNIFETKLLISDIKNIIKLLENNNLKLGEYNYFQQSLLHAEQKLNFYVEFYNQMKNTDNELLKINERYKNLTVLETLLNDLSLSINKEKNSFKNYSIQYFATKGIILNEDIFESVYKLDEKEITNLYSQYQEFKKKSDFNDITKNVDDTILSVAKEVKSLKNKIEFIESNFDDNQKSFEYLIFIKSYNSSRKNYEAKFTQLRTRLYNYSLDENSDNPFVKYLFMKEVEAQRQKILKDLDSDWIVPYSDVYNQMSQNVYNLTTNLNNTYSSISNAKTKIEDYTKQIEKLSAENEWWKIISNIGRNNQISELQSKIKETKEKALLDFEKYKDDVKIIVGNLREMKMFDESIIEEKVLTQLENSIVSGEQIVSAL